MTVDLPVGYVPLLDAAPLIVADALGFAEEEGLHLALHAAPSWANLRDRLAQGQVAAAQMLAPVPVAASAARWRPSSVVNHREAISVILRTIIFPMLIETSPDTAPTSTK